MQSRLAGVWADNRARSFLAALVLIVFLFPDIIFLGGSLAPIDYDHALYTGRPAATVSVYPESATRKIEDSWGDIGAAAWQFEPAVLTLARAMRTGESPWWNPYDATGRMGPESMVDVLFSPVTVCAAVFGGGSTALTFVLLALYLTTAYCLIRSLNRYLGVSFFASCAAAAVYLLSGFSLGNLNSQMGQPYYLGPLALLSLLAYEERTNPVRLALCALAHALLFLVTFFPTLVLVVLSVHGIVLAHTLGQGGGWKNGIRRVCLQIAPPVLAVLMTAFLYLPIIEANLRYIDTVDIYNARLTPGYSLQSALSLFTPKHFWQSYRALGREGQWPAIEIERWIFHIGIVASLLAASGVARYRDKRATAVALLCACLAAISVGQMFSIPPFTWIDRLPFFSFVSNHYWPALAGLPLAVLFAFGVDGLGEWGDVALGVTAAAIAASYGYLSIELHLPTLQPARGYAALAALIFLGAMAALLLSVMRVSFARQLRVGLGIAACLEGMFYMNNLHATRSHREQQPPEAVEWVKRRAATASGDRVLNIGYSGLMPDLGSGLGLSEISAIETSILPQYRDFYNRQIGLGLFLSLYGADSKFLFTRESLSLAGVRYAIVDRSYTEAIQRLRAIGLKEAHADGVRFIYENADPLPRAFLVGELERSELLPGAPDRRAATSDLKLLTSAMQAGVSRAPTVGDIGSVDIREYRNTRIRLKVSNRIPAVLVVTDSWHPNWTARIDGSDTYVGRVNLGFRGVVLGAGDHSVEFSYRPKTLTAGLWISGLGSAATLLLLFRKRHRFFEVYRR